MALKELKKIGIQDYATSRLQENVADFLLQITKNPILDGLLVENVRLVFGSKTSVSHGLGRKVRGFVIVYKNNAVEAWAEEVDQTLPKANLILSTSPDATVSLWLF